jgi:hypothetical protein
MPLRQAVNLQQRKSELMRNKPNRTARVQLAALALLSLASAAHSFDLGDSVQLHGFASQDYLQASRNTYLGADDRGTWDNNFLAFIGTFTLNERSKLWAQLESSSTEPTRFTWFFVDYQLTDSIRLHAGRVKYPLGIYNEFIDSKFLQVSSLEPALYQTAADFVHDAYTGIGVDYDQALGSAGRLLWQIFGGNTYDVDPPVDSRDRRAYGGRLTYYTPVNGLRFMVSGYQTHVEVLATRALSKENRVIFSADYLRNAWDVKSEYGTHKFLGVSSNTYYVQVGYTVWDKWMPFARYERVNLDTDLQSSDSYSQKIFVAGVNYKVLSNVSVRVENHFNRGYALPVASGEVPADQGARTWNLLVVGVHVLF